MGLTELNAKNNTVVSISKCAWGTFDATGITELAEALKFNSTLTMINLAQNQLCGLTAQAKGRFNASGILALAPRLRFNTTLKQFNLSDNAIIESGGRPIMEDVLACTGFRLRRGHGVVFLVGLLEVDFRLHGGLLRLGSFQLLLTSPTIWFQV